MCVLQHIVSHCSKGWSVAVLTRAKDIIHAATACIVSFVRVKTATLQHVATYCNTLQQTVTHCNTLQHAATRCNILQHTAIHCNTLCHTAQCDDTMCCSSVLQRIAVCCSVLQCVAVCCSLMQCAVCHNVSAAAHCVKLQKGVERGCFDTDKRHYTRCNTLQHTATHCSTGWSVTVLTRANETICNDTSSGKGA